MAGKILITPSAGSTTVDPTIAFQGAGVSTDIVLRVPSIGGLSFEGVWGQLFSISDSMSGTIYSVNDVSGIPSIEVLDTGLVKIGQYGGNLVLGSGSDDGYKFQVAGTSSYTGDTWHKANARTCYGPNTSWGTYLVVGGDGVNGITRTCGIASIVTTDGNMHIDSGNVKGMYLNFYSGNQGVIFGNGATGQVACIGSGGNLCTSSCVATAGMVCAGTCILGNSYLCVPNCVIAGGAVCGGTVYSGGCIQAGSCLMAGTYICSASCVIAAGSLCGANATVGCCITAVSTYASNCVCGQALYGYAWVCAGAGGVTANTYVCAQTGNISTACCVYAAGCLVSPQAYIGCICTSSGGVISCTYMCTHTGNITSACCVISVGPIYGKLAGCADCAYCSCCALYAYCTCGNALTASSATIASTLTNNSSASASNYPIAWWSGNTLYSTPSGLCVYPSTCGMYIAGCIWTSTCVVAPGFAGRLTGCSDCSYCSCCALYALCSVPSVNFRVDCCVFIAGGISTNSVGNASSAMIGGLSLWSNPEQTTSWMGFKCGNGVGWGVHGSITSTEYATYYVMDTTERGWIWRNATTGTNHTSISNTGVVCSCNCISAPVICAVTAVCSNQICGYDCILSGGYIAAGRCIRAYGCMCACGEINASGTINAPNVCATGCFCGPYYNASGYFYGPLVYATNTSGVSVCSCSIICSLGMITSSSCVMGGGMICSTGCVIAQGYLYTSNWVCAASGLCTPGYICSAGIIYSAGNIIAYNTSDCNLKTNVSNLTCAVCKIKQIRGVEFDWTTEEIARSSVGYFKTHDVGVIAQEVELVLPEAVANRDDGYKGVRYEKLIPLLIEAIKEQQVEIELLQARI